MKALTSIRLSTASNWAAFVWVNIWLTMATFGKVEALTMAKDVWNFVKGFNA